MYPAALNPDTNYVPQNLRIERRSNEESQGRHCKMEEKECQLQQHAAICHQIGTPHQCQHRQTA